MRRLQCHAKIPLDLERDCIMHQLVQRFASSYNHDIVNKIIYATYVGDNDAVIDMFVQTFEKYAEHEIHIDDAA